MHLPDLVSLFLQQLDRIQGSITEAYNEYKVKLEGEMDDKDWLTHCIWIKSQLLPAASEWNKLAIYKRGLLLVFKPNFMVWKKSIDSLRKN